MENNNEENVDKGVYKITLKSLVLIIIIVILVMSLIGIAFYSIYEKKDEITVEDYIQSIGGVVPENKYNDFENKTEEDFIEDVDYNYSDFINSNEYVEEDTDSDMFYDDYTIEDAYKINCESAIEFIYSLNSNPFYEIVNLMNSYDAIKNVEKQSDGSYNINMKFDELIENIYFGGLYPSTLKTIDSLKNNINVLSDTKINVKDTGVKKDFWVSTLSFDQIADKEYEAYALVEEYDDNVEEESCKYIKVIVKFNSNSLITDLTYNEVNREDVPEDLLEDTYYIDDDYTGYSYSDYINQ